MRAVRALTAVIACAALALCACHAETPSEDAAPPMIAALDLPPTTELLAAGQDVGGSDAAQWAKVRLNEADAEAWLTDLGIPAEDYTAFNLTLLGPDRGGFNPNTTPGVVVGVLNKGPTSAYIGHAPDPTSSQHRLMFLIAFTR